MWLFVFGGNDNRKNLSQTRRCPYHKVTVAGAHRLQTQHKSRSSNTPGPESAYATNQAPRAFLRKQCTRVAVFQHLSLSVETLVCSVVKFRCARQCQHMCLVYCGRMVNVVCHVVCSMSLFVGSAIAWQYAESPCFLVVYTCTEDGVDLSRIVQTPPQGSHRQINCTVSKLFRSIPQSCAFIFFTRVPTSKWIHSSCLKLPWTHASSARLPRFLRLLLCAPSECLVLTFAAPTSCVLHK